MTDETNKLRPLGDPMDPDQLADWNEQAGLFFAHEFIGGIALPNPEGGEPLIWELEKC